MLKSNWKTFDPTQLIIAREWLHGYMVKMGNDPNSHPPDNTITAQFLALAPWPRLVDLLKQLFAEQKRPEISYAWFVTLGLQRIHGIGPGIAKRRRAELRIVSAAEKRPRPAEQTAIKGMEPSDTAAIVRQAVAKLRKI